MQKIILAAALAISSPVYADGLCPFSCTQEMPLSRREVRITATGQWLLAFTTQDSLMQAAAETTLKHGYQRFILRGAESGQMYQPTGFQRFGGWGNIYGRRIGQSSATVVMLTPRDPEYADGLDARSIIQNGD